jgi:hypothetical protein
MRARRQNDEGTETSKLSTRTPAGTNELHCHGNRLQFTHHHP